MSVCVALPVNRDELSVVPVLVQSFGLAVLPLILSKLLQINNYCRAAVVASAVASSCAIIGACIVMPLCLSVSLGLSAVVAGNHVAAGVLFISPIIANATMIAYGLKKQSDLLSIGSDKDLQHDLFVDRLNILDNALRYASVASMCMLIFPAYNMYRGIKAKSMLRVRVLSVACGIVGSVISSTCTLCCRIIRLFKHNRS